MDLFKNNMRYLGSMNGKIAYLHDDLTELLESISTTKEERIHLNLFKQLQDRIPNVIPMIRYSG